MTIKYQSNLSNVLSELEKAYDRTLHGVGEFARSEAVLRAPFDTGRLRGSIGYKVNPKWRSGEKSVSIGTNIEYALYLEKGTRYQKAQPYLTPAVEENINKINKLIERLMQFG